MRLVFTLILFISALANTWASHIVGGDFYYQYLGGDKYRITMKLYIDCVNGKPGAIAGDATAMINIFGANTSEPLKVLEFTRTGPVTLFGVPYKCVSNVGNVCVDKYEYVQEVTLPKRKDGYYITFERCCRNNTIKNIVDPYATGSTYWVKIPDRDLVAIDNSPVFKKFPPIFICQGFPLTFDHSATDADGDSLTYELYKPFLGATFGKPAPGKDGSDPTPPPFNNIVWRGGYNTGNQMHGVPILQIDESTGELTVTPDEDGQFVIGVKVLEWRLINGEWVNIGETLRDYQFNIINCQSTPIPYFKAIVACTDTVQFLDKSLSAKNISYEFGDPASGFDNNSSLQRNPIHVFSKGGDYIVKQRAWNESCDDEYSTKVKIRIKNGFDIGKDKIHCVPFKHYLYVPWGDFTSIKWSTGEAKLGYITVDKPGEYMVEAHYGLCVIRDTINIGYDPVSFTPLRDSLFCDKVIADLEIKNRTPKSKIIWNVTDTSAKISVTKEGKYIATVYNTNCAMKDTADMVLAKITPNLGPDLFICNDFTRTLDAGLQPAGTIYTWQDSSHFRTFTTNFPGKYWVRTQLKHCSKTDEMTIDNSKVILDIGPNKHFCDSVRMPLDAGPPNAGTITTYLWSNGETTQQAFIKEPGKHWVLKTDNFGCSNSDTVLLYMTVSPQITIGKDTTICVRSPIPLSPGFGFNDYIWDNGSTDIIRYVEDAGTYSVRVTDESGCSGAASIIVKTDPNRLPNDLYIPNAFSPNGDGLNDLFPFEMPVVYNDYNLKIFTRWGEKIYDSDSTPKPWDGVTLNEADQLDAYIWVATYKACDGVRRIDKGTITVLR